MATTTNYGWTTPDDTALVKDGAAAIRTLGTAIDTTTFNNAAAAINKTIVDAKGDIIAATASDTVARLAVGANGTTLVADSAEATGLKWATPAAGGGSNYTLLNSGGTSLSSGNTVTVSGISGMDKLIVLVRNASSTGSSDFAIRLNTDTGTNYGSFGLQILPNNLGGSYTATNLGGIFEGISANPLSPIHTSWPFAAPNGDTGTVHCFMRIEGCNSAGVKMMQQFSGANTGGTGPQNLLRVSGGVYTGSSTISSVSIFCGSSSTFDLGTIYIYGSA